MRRVVRSVFGVVATAVLLCGVATTAQAEPEGARAEGAVLVFKNELSPSQRYDNPSGCTKLAPDSHLLTNLTDSRIRVYGDPFCLTPSLVVAPGTGAHIQTPISSFSA